MNLKAMGANVARAERLKTFEIKSSKMPNRGGEEPYLNLAVKSTLSRFEGVEEWHAVGSGRYESRREYPVDRDGGRASFGSCHSSTTSHTSSPPPKNRSLPGDAAVDTRTHTPPHRRRRWTHLNADLAVDTRTHNPSQPHAGRSSSSSSRRRAHLAIVVAGRPLPNAVAVDTRTHTPRHNHAQGAAAAEEDVPRNNAAP